MQSSNLLLPVPSGCCWIMTGELSISSTLPAGSNLTLTHIEFQLNKSFNFIRTLPGQTGQQSSLVRMGLSQSAFGQSFSWHMTIPPCVQQQVVGISQPKKVQSARIRDWAYTVDAQWRFDGRRIRRKTKTANTQNDDVRAGPERWNFRCINNRRPKRAKDKREFGLVVS
jgi:hypothetical protein